MTAINMCSNFGGKWCGGTACFYRKFISNFSQWTGTLFESLKKGALLSCME